MSFDEKIKNIERGVSRYESLTKRSLNLASSSRGTEELKIGGVAFLASFTGMYLFIRSDKLSLTRKGMYSLFLGVLAVVAWKAWNSYKKKNP